MCTMLELFKILSDKNRLRIIGLLSLKKLCVCELAYALDVTQPSISRHLKQMKKARLIESEQDGFWTNYFLTPPAGVTGSILQLTIAELKNDQCIVNDLKKVELADRAILCK